MTKALKTTVVKEFLSDRSDAWSVKYVDGLLNITIGCVDQNAAELMAECLNDAVWVQADVGEMVGSH